MEIANDNLAGDSLRGADQIAAFMGWKPREIYHQISKGSLPTYRIGKIVCARKSTLIRWIEAQEQGVAA